LIRSLANPSINSWVLNSFVECSASTKWCPKPGCRFAVEYNDGGPKEITCRCGMCPSLLLIIAHSNSHRDGIGHVFCFQCQSAAHKPAPCDLVLKWNDATGDGKGTDKATEALLAAQCKVLFLLLELITNSIIIDRHVQIVKC
jgi:hypothetical protein